MRGLASCRAGVLRASVSQRSPRINKHPQEEPPRNSRWRVCGEGAAAMWYPCQNQYGGRPITLAVTAIPGNAISLVFQALLFPPESASCLGPSCRSGRLSPGWKAADRWTRRLLGAGTLTGKGRFSNPRWPSAPGCRAPSFKLLEGQPASASCTYLPGGLALWAGTGTWPRCPLPCPWGPCLGFPQTDRAASVDGSIARAARPGVSATWRKATLSKTSRAGPGPGRQCVALGEGAGGPGPVFRGHARPRGLAGTLWGLWMHGSPPVGVLFQIQSGNSKGQDPRRLPQKQPLPLAGSSRGTGIWEDARPSGAQTWASSSPPASGLPGVKGREWPREEDVGAGGGCGASGPGSGAGAGAGVARAPAPSHLPQTPSSQGTAPGR